MKKAKLEDKMEKLIRRFERDNSATVQSVTIRRELGGHCSVIRDDEVKYSGHALLTYVDVDSKPAKAYLTTDNSISMGIMLDNGSRIDTDDGGLSWRALQALD